MWPFFFLCFVSLPQCQSQSYHKGSTVSQLLFTPGVEALYNDSEKESNCNTLGNQKGCSNSIYEDKYSESWVQKVPESNSSVPFHGFASGKANAKRNLGEYNAESENTGATLIESYLAFTIIIILCAGLIQWVLSFIKVFNPPLSIAQFAFGILLYLWAVKWVGKEDAPLFPQGILNISKTQPEILYLIFLPILLFESTIHINWHKFKKFSLSGITLACFGVVYQVFLIGILIRVTFYKTVENSTAGKSSLTWNNSFLVASTLASTDPVAVLSVLKTLQAPDKLCGMFEGEALINDGTSVLLFQFFKSLSRGEIQTLGGFVKQVALLLFLGPIWGYVVGIISFLCMRQFKQYPSTQVIISVGIAYAVYFFGEHSLHTSGPISVVCYGLFYKAFGHIAMDHATRKYHYHLVKGASFFVNTAIFVLAGVIACRMIYEAIAIDNGVTSSFIWHVPVLYIYLILGRATMVVLCLPVLKKTGYGVNSKEAVLLIWGGLRGAIVLSLGLMIEADHKILSLTTYMSLLYIGGSTCLILLINGISFEFLFKFLNPYPPKPFRRVYLERVTKLIDRQYMEDREILRNFWIFKGTNVLDIANLVVPLLGWRKLKENGSIDVKLPNVTDVFMKGTLEIDEQIWLRQSESRENATLGEKPSPRRPTQHLEEITFDEAEKQMNLELSNIREASKYRVNYESKEADSDNGDGEKRAHDATAALFGLRDVRAINEDAHFDAQAYLNVLGETGPKDEIDSKLEPNNETLRRSLTFGNLNPPSNAFEINDSGHKINETSNTPSDKKTANDDSSFYNSRIIRKGFCDVAPLSNLVRKLPCKQINSDFGIPEPPNAEKKLGLLRDDAEQNYNFQVTSSNLKNRDLLEILEAKVDKSGQVSNKLLPLLPKRELEPVLMSRIKANYWKTRRSNRRNRIKGYKYRNSCNYNREISDVGPVEYLPKDAEDRNLFVPSSGIPARVLSAPDGNLSKLAGLTPFEIDSASIGSKEEYLEIPRTNGGASHEKLPRAFVKVCTRDREGELYLMFFNTIRQMYQRLYKQRFIGGGSFLALSAVLDLSTDFALGKMRKSPLKKWKEVFEKTDYNSVIEEDLELKQNFQITADMTGFEFEWKALVTRLHCMLAKTRHCQGVLKCFISVARPLLYTAAVNDLQQITAYVDVHEELLWKGGASLHELLGEKLVLSLKRQLQDAKCFIYVLKECYVKNFSLALVGNAAILLINLKQQILTENMEKGLILQEDWKTFNKIFELQHQNIASFRPINRDIYETLSCLKVCRKKQEAIQDTV